ncbi:hypothetical protein N8A98_06650 [Devosia neptuniae]|uniref:Uncharacterized protein n=1 Tax=Devosia neptuniae TaxID=191302 RepID=A0ABY6CF48_9HYPH|nr:hypothetical protein [Devosia neptuniae]UXN70860.1 hypothetical protein N8A98_06650 [Devosia neptuniae]
MKTAKPDESPPTALQRREEQVARIQKAAGAAVIKSYSPRDVEMDVGTVVCALLDRIEALEGREAGSGK